MSTLIITSRTLVKKFATGLVTSFFDSGSACGTALIGRLSVATSTEVCIEPASTKFSDVLTVSFNPSSA